MKYLLEMFSFMSLKHKNQIATDVFLLNVGVGIINEV